MVEGVQKLKGDKGLWVIVILFAMISIVAVFSSSSFLAKAGGISKTAVFLEQTKSVLIGFTALFCCYLIPLKWYRFFAFIAFGVSLLLLMMLFIPPFQARINGAVRGVRIGPVTFQVFEIAKIGIILYLSRALEKWDLQLDTFKDFFLKIALPIFATCLLIVPNSVSSALLVGGVSILMLIFLNVKWKYILSMIGIVVLAGGFMYSIYLAGFKGHPDRLDTTVGTLFNRFETVENRFEHFLSEEEIDESSNDERRQSENARVAISEGGLFGKGPGKSTQRYSLSMAFSDFIYAFIVEEYGLFGGIIVLVLYLALLFRCIRLCMRCSTTFASGLVIGISFLIVTQAFLHILVNVRLIPITGHTLPLISHGGTAYLVLSGALGMILSVNRQLDRQDEIREKQISTANQQLGNYEKESTDNY